jgi:hypothetical protein
MIPFRAMMNRAIRTWLNHWLRASEKGDSETMLAIFLPERRLARHNDANRLTPEM